MQLRRHDKLMAPLIIVATALLLHGHRAPYVNEGVYLVRLRHVARPSYLGGDWTMKGTFGENLVFNSLLAPLANVASINVIAWVGRVTMWVTLALMLIALGKRMELNPWMSCAAVVAWMPWQLEIMGGDWMFGTFEAKPIAYCCVLGSLIAACDQRVALSLALAGAALSFHPGIGILAAPAIAIALLLCAATRRSTRRSLWMLFVTAAPGVYGIAKDFGGSSGSRELWELMATRIYPFHLNPWHFGVASVIALGFMVSAILLVYSSTSNHAHRVLTKFVVVTSVPAAFGIAAYSLGMYEWVRFFPFRFFPVAASLLFSMTVAWCVQHRHSSTASPRLIALVVIALIASFVAQNPVRSAAFMARATVREWTQPRSDLQRSYDWIRGNTPRDAVVVAPPGLDPHYDTERRQVATFGVPRWDRVAEWEQRMLAQLGSSNRGAYAELKAGVPIDALFQRLTPERVQSLARRYGATILVSETSYDLEVLHRQGRWTVYAIQGEP